MTRSGVRTIPCGDAAVAFQFDEPPSPALALRIATLHQALRRDATRGLIESVAGLNSLTVIFDPDVQSLRGIERCVARALASEAAPIRAPAHWRIPVCYQGELAPDLDAVARRCALDPNAVIEAHASRAYTIYLLGFSPGFPYMGDLDPRLELPRRADPRPRVPAGSVAIATGFTAIYPQATAGGWHIIGTTPLTLFDAAREPPALMAAGDSVSFEPVTRSDFERIRKDGAAGLAKRRA